jgi:hypothetical protein
MKLPSSCLRPNNFASCNEFARGFPDRRRPGRHLSPSQRPAVVVAAVVLIGLSGWSSDVGGLVAPWLPWAGFGDVEPRHALMIVGVMLLQLATANQLVRLVLTAVGAVRPPGQPQPSDRLKGGRLLGPMERLPIVGLGLSGQLAIASAVVAAKGIIRFPELTAQRRESGEGPASTR